LCPVEVFLRQRDHRIVFHFTPKHASWLNQIEIWFSILVRKLIRRGNFASRQMLKTRIEQLITYFNATMARPFRWTSSITRVSPATMASPHVSGPASAGVPSRNVAIEPPSPRGVSVVVANGDEPPGKIGRTPGADLSHAGH
jgi:hypothetical protein